ncbi:MAG TPA: CooT family nickel-binding protein [Chloroflexi bacterium]|nr:CooT family nickel-binding protein [Chloroflexota bacterium]
MCQADVYLGDQLVAKEVTGLEPVEEGVRLAAFFEEPQIVPGRIRRIDFLKHQVWLDPLEEEKE